MEDYGDIEGGEEVSKFTVVIPSKDAQNLEACLKAVYQFEPGCDVVVVDDGLERFPRGPQYVMGEKPFCFAKNINIGIQAVSKDRDVILMNDDALLKTPGGFSGLASYSRTWPEFGLIAPVSDGVGNPNQQPTDIRPTAMIRSETRMVCFVCVYIPRTTLDVVGLLDERYVGYGLDDDDYCFSVRKAGLKLGICDACHMNHSTLTSTFRGHGKDAPFTGNMKLFIEKWGTDNWEKGRGESDFSSLFPEEAV